MPSATQDSDVEMRDAASPAANPEAEEKKDDPQGPQDQFIKDTSLRIRVVSTVPTSQAFQHTKRK